MKYEISKELFEAVYNEDYLLRIEVGTYSIVAYLTDGAEFTENIDTFFFDCKKWAYNQGYIIFSSQQKTGWAVFIQTDSDGIIASFEGLEQQAVFDACQWILDKDKQ